MRAKRTTTTLTRAVPMAVAWLACAQVWAGAVPDAQRRCAAVEFSADVARCDDNTCALSGHALLTCDTLTLRADEMEIQFTAERDFAGAKASGHAVLVDRNTVVSCAALTLAPDRIRGKVVAATVQVKRAAPGSVLPRDDSGVPQGKDASVLHGDLERTGKDTLVIKDGDFTLCDCGEDPPSWRVDSPKIEVTEHERALLWWPMLYVSPFGLGPVPVTPPLLPASIPLQSRAMGFLPPQITFFGPWPLVDVPFFVPLGDAWDLTLTPGIRTDWVSQHEIAPSHWGAPRAGVRLRYAPLQGLRGEARVHWTWDHKRFVANQYLRDSGITPDDRAEALAENADLRARHAALQELEHRLSVFFHQDFAITDEWHWLTDVDWPADDRIRQDFTLLPSEQVVNYVPSRTSLTWAPRSLPFGVAAGVAADYLVVVGNNQTEYVNYRGDELSSEHRGPAARVTMLPWAPAPTALPGLYLDADLGFARYGAWDPSLPATLVLAGAQVGAAVNKHLAPFELSLRAASHAYWTEAAPNPGAGLAFVELDGQAHFTLVGPAWGDGAASVRHTLRPVLRLRAVPWVFVGSTLSTDARPARIDERLDVAVLAHAEVALEQALWLGDHNARQVGFLRLAVPFDLKRGKFAGFVAEARFAHEYLGSGSAWLMLDPSGRKGADAALDATREPLKELGAQWGFSLGPVTLATSYVRFAPSAERFNRSPYGLFGSARAQDSILTTTAADWSHALSPSASVHVAGFRLGLAALTLLPLPGGAQTEPARPFVSQMLWSAGYASSCDCWDIGLYVVHPGYGNADAILKGLKVQVMFSIAGYAIANMPN